MSKVLFWVEAVCASCARTAPGRFVGTLPKREMIAAAKRSGFSHYRGDWVCGDPACRDTRDMRLSNEGSWAEPTSPV